ncbi:MAG: ankyrin repeat domain-containing protein [Candidatus Hodarchaeota archaeon]
MSEIERDLRGYAYSGNIEELKKVIKKGVNINAADSEGTTALHNATIWMPHLQDKDFLGITKLLVENGADVNATNKYKETPLLLAAFEGYYEIVVYLHEKGAKIDVANDGGFNPLHEIAKKIPGRPMNYKLIIERNGKKVEITDPDEIRKIQGSHPDDEYFGYVNTAKYLIDNGINVNQQTKERKQTPLFHASDEGVQELVEMILEKGVENINHQDSYGLTVLHYASRKGYLGIVKALIAAGSDPNIKENYGFTPLHETAENGHLEILKFLIENGGDVNSKLTKDFDPYKTGDTPLDIAKKANKKNIIAYLTKFK